MRETELIFWSGLDNVLSLFLTETNAQTGLTQVIDDLSGITRVVVTIGDETFDSDTLGATVIWWTEQEADAEDDDTLKDVLKLRLGPAIATAAMAAGEYECHAVAFDADHTNGLGYHNEQYRARVKA